MRSESSGLAEAAAQAGGADALAEDVLTIECFSAVQLLAALPCFFERSVIKPAVVSLLVDTKNILKSCSEPMLFSVSHHLRLVR